MQYRAVADDRVGILLDRSEQMIIALLAVLKAGGAYVPIDARYPNSRKGYLLSDAQVKVLLTDSTQMFEVSGWYSGSLFSMDIELPVLDTSSENPVLVNGPGDLAYLMYTSGSAGTPKGVQVEHGNVIRLVKEVNYITFGSSDRLLQTGSLSFDASTFEIWGMLLHGGELHLLGYEDLMDSHRLKSKLLGSGITKLWLTSSWFNQLCDTDVTMFSGLEYLVIGGEALSVPHVNRVIRTCPSVKLINGYGPTENTTFSLTLCDNRRAAWVSTDR